MRLNKSRRPKIAFLKENDCHSTVSTTGRYPTYQSGEDESGEKGKEEKLLTVAVPHLPIGMADRWQHQEVAVLNHSY